MGRCIDDFRSGSVIAGVVKLLVICGMKEFLSFEKLFWLYNILPLGELVSKLNCDCTCVSTFSCNKHSFVFGIFQTEYFLGIIHTLGTKVSSIFQTLSQTPIFKPVEHLRRNFFSKIVNSLKYFRKKKPPCRCSTRF